MFHRHQREIFTTVLQQIAHTKNIDSMIMAYIMMNIQNVFVLSILWMHLQQCLNEEGKENNMDLI